MRTARVSILVLFLLAAWSGNSQPDTATLINSQSDNNDWLIPGKTYGNNRVTGLTQITPANVSGLKKAWVTPVTDDGEEEASPIVYNGTVYLSTAHDNILALDGTSGKLKWDFPYSPAFELQYAVNRGVGLADGNVYIVTQDCRLIAVDASSGKQTLNVPACHDTSNTWYTMAAYVYKDNVIVGTSGGDLGGSGLVSAFDAKTGSRLWDWHTVAQPGAQGHDTWQGDSWVHGGAAVWGGLSIGDKDVVYAATGKPGLAMTVAGRHGTNLYSDSVIALDTSGSQPKLKWYYQITKHGARDVDPVTPPVLFDATVEDQTRKLLGEGDKAGDFIVLDRTNGKLLYRTALTARKNEKHTGGLEWNGGAYASGTNMFYIPSTQVYAAPKRRRATGELTAIDMGTGKVAWNDAFPYAAQGGVVVAPGNLLFTSDTRGRIYAIDGRTGHEFWHDDVGSAVVAPLSAYQGSDGNEYLVVFAGEAGSQKTPNLPKTQGARVVAYRLNVTDTAMNDTTGQPKTVGVASGVNTHEVETGTGTMPYTEAQVAAGHKVYATQCLSCHGAHLEGIAGPALTGPGFAHAKLNGRQIYTIVTKQMPLTAPGSLSATDYADVMAYIMKTDCVKASGAAPGATGGSKPFTAADVPALANVTVGSASCQ